MGPIMACGQMDAFFFISRHYIWHISCIFSRCIAFIALRWIDLTRLVLSSVIFKLLITTIECLGQNILLAADRLTALNTSDFS